MIPNSEQKSEKGIHLHLHGDLVNFLKPNLRFLDLAIELKGTPTIKHLVESLRIPHTEIGSVRVNGKWEELNFIPAIGAVIDVFPMSGISEKNEPAVPTDLCKHFLLDNHLGKLAVYLRILGQDVDYRNDYQDAQLVEIAFQESKTLLTRDRGLLMHKKIEDGLLIRSMNPGEQLVEVYQRYGFQIHLLSRCLRCNSSLQVVDKAVILDRLQPLTRKYFNEFRLCPNCDQIFWKGSHYLNMLAMMKDYFPNEFLADFTI